MINESLYKRFEEETISRINRFKISKKDLNELKKSFRNRIVLISVLLDHRQSILKRYH